MYFEQNQTDCLICNKEFSNEAMKPSRLIDHFRKAHPDKASKPIEYFELLILNYHYASGRKNAATICYCYARRVFLC